MNEESNIKLSTRALIILGLLSLLSIALATAAWCQLGQTIQQKTGAEHDAIPFFDAIYRGLKTVEMGEAYDHLGEDFEAATDLTRFEIETARWIGAFVKLAAILLIIYGLFSKGFVQLLARLKNDHLVIVGASDFATMLAQTVTVPVVHLCHDDDSIFQKRHVVRLPLRSHLNETLIGASAHNAAHIVIATDRDDTALEMSVRILRHCNDASKIRQAWLAGLWAPLRSLVLAVSKPARQSYPVPEVSVRMHDPWLGKRAHQLKGAETLHALSEAEIAAHFVAHSHPPFLLAQDQGQSAVHCLVMGDHDWLEAVLSEIILSSVTLTYGKPVFSFVCEAPDDFAARLRHRYPEIDQVCDLHFHRASPLSHTEGFSLSLAALSLIVPVTAVYITLSDRAAGLAVALAVREHATKTAAWHCPIFLLSDSAEGLDRPAAGSRLEPYAVVPFGAMADIALASGFLSQETGIAERDFHEAYMAISDISGDAVQPWATLKEEYRVSNRRAVGHIAAKLFEAGFDLRPWLGTHDIWASLPTLAENQPLYRDDRERMRLAELEHVRWMADRRLGGWSYGPDKDPVRKIHPDLKAFDKLTQRVKSYDVQFIEALNNQILKHAPDGVSR